MSLVVFTSVLALAYRYAMEFGHEAACPIWLPDSVLLCALLVTPMRRWWWFLLIPLVVRLLVSVPPSAPLTLLLLVFAIDSAKAVVAALLLRRALQDPLCLSSLRDLSIYLSVTVLLVPAASAFAGAGARLTLGADYWSSWEQWFLGGALAHLVVTPVLFYWVLGRGRKSAGNSGPVGERRVEGTLLFIGLCAASLIAFDTPPSPNSFSEPRFYAPVPFLFWGATRFAMRGATGAIAVLTVVAVGAALSGNGPFRGQSPSDTALTLQHFLLLRVVPLYFVAVLIEQQHRVEDSLRESERRFRSMADSAPAMIWMSSAQNRFEFFNRGWLEYTGQTLVEARASCCSTDVHPDDRNCFHARFAEAAEARDPFEVEFRLRRSDGTYGWVLSRGVPRYGPNDTFMGYIGSALDITDRRRADDAERNLERASRLTVLGELTALVAHEVQQPLAAILSHTEAAELLLRSPNPSLDTLREILADIRETDLHASATIGRIRDLFRRRDLAPHAIDVEGAIREMLRLVAGEAQRRGIELRAQLSGGLPPVHADRVHLQQVLLNLIVNGMDAMAEKPAGERTLEVSTRRSERAGLEIAVRDYGHGIRASDLPLLFDSFFTTRAEGMGVGLAIARSIVERYGGRIWVETELGVGTTFRLWLPAETPAEALDTPAGRAEHRGPARTEDRTRSGDASSAPSS